MKNHVQFVDRFVGRVELTRWLQAADVFVTPYPNLDQIVSGTLSYAMGAGRTIVSTPYAYASELLAEGRGVLVAPGSPSSLSTALTAVLGDRELRAAIGRRAYEYSRGMVWSEVGAEYGRLFAQVADERADELARPGPFGPRWWPSMPELAPLPRVSRSHLDDMTDRDRDHAARDRVPSRTRPTGTAWTTSPAPSRSTCSIAASSGWPAVAERAVAEPATSSSRRSTRTGRFRNFRAVDGTWADGIGSQDCQGGRFSALGDVIEDAPDARPGPDRDRTVRTTRCRRPCELTALRAQASVLLGCAAKLRAAPDSTTEAACRRIADPFLAPVPGGGIVAVAVAGIAGHLRERAACPGADRRRDGARLAGDGRHRSRRPRLAHQRPDLAATATSRRSATGGGRARVRRPGSTSSRSRRRRCCSRPSRRTCVTGDALYRDGHGTRLCLVPRRQRPRRGRRRSGSAVPATTA